jgi:molybdate transport system substrate-binding protein
MRNALVGLLVVVISGVRDPSSLPRPARPDRIAAERVELNVAGAQELDPALREVARAFELKPGTSVRLTFQESRSLASQIRTGAAFDAFFAADTAEARGLVASGKAVPASLREFAGNGLVLCISPLAPVELPLGNPLLVLRNKAIAHVAVADPHTGSGQAAFAALRRAHLYDVTLRRKLLVGEDAAQVARFLQNGNADVALLPASMAKTLAGVRVIPVAAKLAPPLPMAAIVIARSRHPRESQEFLNFAASTRGRTIFARHGFAEPHPGVK